VAARQAFAINRDWDLLLQQQIDTQNANLLEIRKMNRMELERLQNYSPIILSDRAQTIDLPTAKKLVRTVNQHPVISSWQEAKYNQPGVEIGFCFGRATYFHLALLKMGLHKSAIKKIWAVGPLEEGRISWQFHVATLVKTTDGTWLALDNFTGGPVSVKDWTERMQSLNPDKTLRFYISEPDKFSVSLGSYDRLQMGLDLSPDRDWYRGYFKDLMKSFSPQKISDSSIFVGR
jgi:hypothetical protein